MMFETGIVNRVEKNIAWVKMIKGEQCSGCHACNAFGEGVVELIALNGVAAKPGDRVEVEIDPNQVVKHSAIVFLLPVLGLILGYFLGAKYLEQAGLSQQSAGIIGSFGLLLVMFAAIIGYDRLVAKSQKINATIQRVL
ncbi:MAG: SoxR reducing system RseC family protein [bacterium]|jgi:sigma-E factor negative regulatory protein RseC|nr:SoxR reducing system RseC family protein [bacterium]